jgi:hypothetical protein
MNTNIVIAVAVLLFFAIALWYYRYRYNTFFVAKSKDGTEVAISCGSNLVKILNAKYATDDVSTDVTATLQELYDKSYKNGSSYTYTVNAADFGLAPSADGGLSFRYKCEEQKNKFANQATHDRLMNFVRQREIRHSGNGDGNSTRKHELGALILPANNFCY